MGAYAPLEQVPDGSFVRVEGIASPRRGAYSRFLSQHEVFPLIASRLLVDRRQAPDDSLRGYAFPFHGEGRLSRAGSRYEGVVDQFVHLQELPRDAWVLEDGVVPRRGLRMPLEALFWLLLVIGPLAVALRRLLSAKKQR
jgi:hypothetical protein